MLHTVNMFMNNSAAQNNIWYEGQALDQSEGVRLQLVTDTKMHISVNVCLTVNHKAEYGIPPQNPI